MDLIRTFGLIINPTAEKPLHFAVKEKGARAVKDQVLAPRTINLVTATVQTDAREVLLLPFGFDNRLRTANSTNIVRNGLVQVQVVNLDPRPIFVAAGTQLASVQPCRDALQKAESNVNLVMPLGQTNEKVIVGEHLTDQQMKELLALLSKYENAFSTNGLLGHTTLLEHQITLEVGAKPFKEPLRRHPSLHVREVSKQIKDMLKKDVIEQSASP